MTHLHLHLPCTHPPSGWLILQHFRGSGLGSSLEESNLIALAPERRDIGRATEIGFLCRVARFMDAAMVWYSVLCRRALIHHATVSDVPECRIVAQIGDSNMLHIRAKVLVKKHSRQTTYVV